MKRLDRPSFLFLDNNNFPIAFAHRGGDLAGQENTMRAFTLAHELGYRYLETDVFRSADYKVVAGHGSKSEREERVTGLPRRTILQSLTYAEIKRRYRVDGEVMPLLEEILDEETLPGVRVNIDPKTPDVVEPLTRLLGRVGVDRVCIGSFSYERTKAVAEGLRGQSRVCTSLGPLGFMALWSHGVLVPGYLSRTRAACLQVPYNHVTESMIQVAHDNNLLVHVWTPNLIPEMERALDNGVDGVISDNVIDLKHILVARGAWHEAA